MNRDLRYILYMLLMAVLLAGLVLIAPGCTIYTVERTNETTRVKVISTRDFEQPELHYSRDGDSAEFDFGAASAQTNNVMEQIGQTVVEELLRRYMPPDMENP